MSDKVSGTLQVGNQVLLNTGSATLEVIVFPLQTSMAWPQIVERSVQAFLPYHGQKVTLQGSLHGAILASAILDQTAGLRAGTFRGRIEAASGVILHIELRIDSELQVVSADFFRTGTYQCSMRARFREINGWWTAASPRYIFDADTDSSVGGHLEFLVLSPQLVQIKCIVPSAMPEEFVGELSLDSELFRVLNIEVDKLEGLPWPPEYSTSDIPIGEQPATLGTLNISLASILRRAGIDARVQHNDGALDAAIGARTGRPSEEDRWDERELHEIMDAHYSRNMNEREWWLYLLLITRFDGGPRRDDDGSFRLNANGQVENDGIGTTGIIFDHTIGNIRDPWSPFAEWFAQNRPQLLHLVDFGRNGSFVNSRARQGVAVFWREALDFEERPETWYRNRQFLRTIIHELGHALNLAHAWLVGRADTTSFMMYPHRYPHGTNGSEKTRQYWQKFDYQFDLEELFHFKHGFYNELVPGGRLAFMEWTPSSIFRDPTAGGTRANIALKLQATKDSFRFTEPVTVELDVKNHTPDELPLGRLSPAYGDVRFIIRKPNGTTLKYQPPLQKCELQKQGLAGNDTIKHVTSLAVGHNGFIFDTPGRYEITALLPDPSSGLLVAAQPISIWVKYPDATDEEIARQVFTREAAMFLYMAGGEHLTGGKKALNEVQDRYPSHPFAAHANLVLGLNELSGQKSPLQGRVIKSNPTEAAGYLARAQAAQVFSPISQRRLEATLKQCDPGYAETQKSTQSRRSKK